MAPKVKSILIKLVSAAGTGYFYATKKNPTNVPHKLALMKVRARMDGLQARARTREVRVIVPACCSRRKLALRAALA